MHTAGEIDLDENIEKHLKSYKLPVGKQTADNPVTFRNIFAHTSGITAGGYQGYAKGLDVPSDIEILKGETGVNSQPVTVLSKPNEILAYSGGGYTLAEVALRDIYDDTFSNLMKTWILDPAGMKRSELPAGELSDKVMKIEDELDEIQLAMYSDSVKRRMDMPQPPSLASRLAAIG